MWWVKCPRCGSDAAHSSARTVAARLCGSCAELAREAVVNSVTAACRLHRVSESSAALIVDRVRDAMPSPSDPLVPVAIGDRLERAAVVGADVWERLVLELDSSPARVQAVSALRGYRHSVVRVMLDALTQSGVIVWQ